MIDKAISSTSENKLDEGGGGEKKIGLSWLPRCKSMAQQRSESGEIACRSTRCVLLLCPRSSSVTSPLLAEACFNPLRVKPVYCAVATVKSGGYSHGLTKAMPADIRAIRSFPAYRE